MRTLLLVSLAFVIAMIVGFGGTISALNDGRQVTAKQYGQWYGWPEAGNADIDPYLRAELARSGKLQLGRAEGVVFNAENDEDGEPLSGDCTYTISGQMPRSSVWTIRAKPTTNPGFLPFASEPSTQGAFNYLVSSELQFDGDDIAEIVVSAMPSAGNWLKAPNKRYSLALSIYDTNAFVVVGNETVTLPTIKKGKCS